MTVDTDDLVAAIKDFESSLPGWWFTIGHCSLSRDASCAPDGRVPGPDQALVYVKEFDDGFHCDDREGTLASSLRNVTRWAVEARERYRNGLGNAAETSGTPALK